MATRKTAAADRPLRVTLRSYDVGFGDCFLLTFHYARFDRHVLIDFGSTRLPAGKAGGGDYLLRIARQIREDCGGRLDAVVATHRHKDHISGFAARNGDGPGAIIRDLRPKLVIQPWTEDPDAARDADRPTRNLAPARARVARHLRMLADMNRYAGFALQAAEHLKGRLLADLRDQLAFLGDDNSLANRDAVTNLMTMAPKRRYVYFGARSGLEPLLPGVAVRVLGPPTLAQTQAIARQRAVDKDQFWHAMGARADFWSKRADLAARDAAAFAPLFPEHATTRYPWDARWYRSYARREQAESLLAIVRALDDAMNNTSVILLFEAGDKRLLFPGDAQYENWMYALAQPGVRELLGGVDLYKVGHHGSLNATPKDLWDGFEKRGPAAKADRLLAFLSTREGVHGRESTRTEVPRRTLVEALGSESTLVDTRALAPDQLASVTTLSIGPA